METVLIIVALTVGTALAALAGITVVAFLMRDWSH